MPASVLQIQIAGMQDARRASAGVDSIVELRRSVGLPTLLIANVLPH